MTTTGVTLSRRAAAAIAAAFLGLAVLAGCSSDNVNCGVDSCTVTFDRGASASASVLGVEAKVVRVDGGQVTVEVAGEQVQLSVGQPATEVAGLQVALDRVTEDEVQVRISR